MNKQTTYAVFNNYHNIIAEFTTKEQAQKYAKHLNNDMPNGYQCILKKKDVVIYDLADERIEEDNDKARASALTKLTTVEKRVLGLIS